MARRRKRKSPSRGWAKRQPSKLSTRRKMPLSCFLDRKNRKYPVCAKGTRGRQKVSCKGVSAAYSRAKQQGKTGVAKKALRLAKRKRCGWFGKAGSASARDAKRWGI